MFGETIGASWPYLSPVKGLGQERAASLAVVAFRLGVSVARGGWMRHRRARAHWLIGCAMCAENRNRGFLSAARRLAAPIRPGADAAAWTWTTKPLPVRAMGLRTSHCSLRRRPVCVALSTSVGLSKLPTQPFFVRIDLNLTIHFVSRGQAGDVSSGCLFKWGVPGRGHSVQAKGSRLQGPRGGKARIGYLEGCPADVLQKISVSDAVLHM